MIAVYEIRLQAYGILILTLLTLINSSCQADLSEGFTHVQENQWHNDKTESHKEKSRQ